MRRFNVLAISLIAISMAAAVICPRASATAATETSLAAALPTPVDKPPYSAYKGVTIGMKTDEARTKLGGPKEKSDEQDSFEFSSSESAQVYYDATHAVTAVMVTYTGKLDGVPTPKDVFGEDAPAKPDGGIFKMVRYPKAGFWISYNKTSGDDPMIIIALNKM